MYLHYFTVHLLKNWHISLLFRQALRYYTRKRRQCVNVQLFFMYKEQKQMILLKIPHIKYISYRYVRHIRELRMSEQVELRNYKRDMTV